MTPRWDRLYRSPQALSRRAEGYFTLCDENNQLYGEAGLALHLGVTLDTLRAWYDGGDPLSPAVRTAYLRIQSQAESSMAYKGMATRAVFLLRQPRFGGYQERPGDPPLEVRFGRNMDETDFD